MINELQSQALVPTPFAANAAAGFVTKTAVSHFSKVY
jgi:hypothetical protein